MDILTTIFVGTIMESNDKLKTNTNNVNTKAKIITRRNPSEAEENPFKRRESVTHSPPVYK